MGVVASFFLLEKFYLSKKFYIPVQYIFSITIGLTILFVLKSLFGNLGFFVPLLDVLFSCLFLYYMQRSPNSKKVTIIILIYNIFCLAVGIHAYLKFHNEVSSSLLYEGYLIFAFRFSIVNFSLYQILNKKYRVEFLAANREMKNKI